MSDGFADIEGIPSWEQYVLGAVSVAQESHNPEETMQVALTGRELALLCFGNILLNRMFPEFGGAILELQMKLQELAGVQQFLPSDEDVGPDEVIRRLREMNDGDA